MPLINKLLKVFPKKKIDLKDIEKPVQPQRLVQVETYIKTNTTKQNEEDGLKSKSEIGLEEEIEYEIVEREIIPEKIVCPDCGGITLEGLEYCDKCGGELKSYQ